MWCGPTAVALQVYAATAPSRPATRDATSHEHQPINRAAVVRIVWPPQSTIVNPKHFPEVAAMLTRLIAEAATTLAQIKARRRL